MATLNSKNTSLIVIDVQKYFIPGYPGAISPAIPGQDEAQKLANVLALIKAAKKHGLTTFVTYEAGKRGLDARPLKKRGRRTSSSAAPKPTSVSCSRRPG